MATSGHVYFTLKDKDTGAILDCIAWKSTYSFSGISVEIGLEIAVKGSPNVYSKNGRLSFVCSTLELVGDGALKLAYERLKKKLQEEGLFADSRKRPIPKFPKSIGVITSTKGAVIHDFSNNLRKSGFNVKILNCTVEGPESGKDLILSVRAMRKESIDVLVIIRGGGSIQSLAGFDNEVLVREVVNFPVPVIVGVGHHQDVTLTALAADKAESTPSLVAIELGKPWENAQMILKKKTNIILNTYKESLYVKRSEIEKEFNRAKTFFEKIIKRFDKATIIINESKIRIKNQINQSKQQIILSQNKIKNRFSYFLSKKYKDINSVFSTIMVSRYKSTSRFISQKIEHLQKIIETNNPERIIKLGYSIVYLNDSLVRSISQIELQDDLTLRVADGTVETKITKINKQ